MKRAIFLCALIFIFSTCAGDLRISAARGSDSPAQAENVAPGQSSAGKACPFNIIGTWKIEGRTESDSLFYAFSTDGWVRVVSHSADVLPREYEIIAEVKYALDEPSAPKRVEFVTKRGNDAFPAGKTALMMVEYGDDSFITQNSETGDRIQWTRAQTHRYFITFAARDASDTPAFAMWTTLDGREPKIEALGLRKENQNVSAPVFGPIPERIYHEFENESGKGSDVMFRFELTEAEFGRSHKVFETWSEYARTAKLPHSDPYLNGMEFLKSAAENLNQCEEKLKLEAAAAQNPHQQTMQYIRMMRKKNKPSHVTDGMFPWDWRPMLLSN